MTRASTHADGVDSHPTARPDSVPDTRVHADAITFADVVVQYPGRSARALDGVTFTARPGTITAVVGPNGSGKSTLVRALLRMTPLQQGHISIGQQSVHAMQQREFATRVAVVPQREEALIPLRVDDFVALGRHAHRSAFGNLGKQDLRSIGDAMLRCGVSDSATRRTDQLSGGEWQRVRIARALAQDTPVIVLDEPTSFLDIAHEMAVFELLDSLARDGHTVLLVSHQLNLVARFAAHIVLLNHGAIAATGSAADVMRGELLEQVYDWPLVVTRDLAVGALSLLPLRRRGPVRP